MAVHNYTFTLTTLGPLHVGNGQTYGKTDYFVTKDGKHVGVMDVHKFIQRLTPRQMDDYLELLEGGRQSEDLTSFLMGEHLERVAQDACLYQAQMYLSRNRRGAYNYCDVHQCVKDGWGKPYVPGSSLKGLIRTVLLGELIARNPSEFAQSWQKEDVRSTDRHVAGRAAKGIEDRAFGDPLESDPADHAMHYISVSDSKPLELSDLVFAQKYDAFAQDDRAEHKWGNRQSDMHGNKLNIYRESIKPGVEISFEVSVDDRIKHYLPGIELDQAGIATVFKAAADRYDRSFSDKFGESSSIDTDSAQSASDGRCRHVSPSGLRCRNSEIPGTGYCRLHQDEAGKATSTEKAVCYLGGGVGFTSKTVEDALFGDEADYVNEVSRILFAQFPTKLTRGKFRDLEDDVREAGFNPVYRDYRGKQRKEDHRHWQDGELGVSPHTFKYGIVDGEKYPMGKCELRIEER